MTSVLKLLKTVDPKTRKYIRYYKISEIYESLLSGLTVVRPEELIPWLIEKLEHLQQVGMKELKWDMFIPLELRPKQKPVEETTLNYIFNVLDEMLEPTPEMIEKAYKHYNENLHKKVYSAMRKFYLLKLYDNKKTKEQEKLAIEYHKRKTTGLYFNEWLQWLRFRKDRQAIAFAKIQRVLVMSHMRVIIEQWHLATKEARSTREYFERLERGENVDENEMVSSNGEARDDMSMLPRIAAVKIFSYLSIEDLCRCAQVCRSWKMITNSNLLWSKLDLHHLSSRLNDRLFNNLVHKSRPFLIHLNLRGCARITSGTFVSISGCRNIQDLNLSQCRNLTDELLNIVTKGCHVLLYLNISFNENIGDPSIRSLAKNCVNLEYLSLAGCTRLTDKGFSYLDQGEGLKKLVYIDLSGCKNITPTGCQLLSQHSNKIQALILNNFLKLTDKHLKYLGQSFPQLTEVSILESPLLTDDSLRYLSESRHLRKLKIASNNSITDAAIKQISKNCSDLRYVSLQDCERISDASLKCLAACKELSVLNLADSVRISDTGVKFLTDGACGPKLRELNLTNCLRVTAQSLSSLSRKCKNVAYLSVGFCEQIDAEGIDIIGTMENLLSIDLTGCNCTDNSLKGLGTDTLRHVSFCGCSDITDLGLSKFCTKCPNLESLDLSDCPQITDNSIKSLAFCCKFIVNLNLSGCKLVTDMSLQYLSGVCAYLNTVNISKCPLVTDKGLRYLRRGCKYLKKLSVVDCPNISREMVEKMQAKLEQVEFLSTSQYQYDLEAGLPF